MMKQNFELHKEIIKDKLKELGDLSNEYGMIIQQKEEELSNIRKELRYKQDLIKSQLEQFYSERGDNINKFIDKLDLLDEKVILPSKLVGYIKSYRLSLKGTLILSVDYYDSKNNLNITRDFPYNDLTFYRDYLDNQLKSILDEDSLY